MTSLEHLVAEYRNASLVDAHLAEHRREAVLSSISSFNRGTFVEEFEKLEAAGDPGFDRGGAHFHTWDGESFAIFVDFLCKEFGVVEIARGMNQLDLLTTLRKPDDKDGTWRRLECERLKEKGLKIDTARYKATFSDLAALSDSGLEGHFWNYGCMEGREAFEKK